MKNYSQAQAGKGKTAYRTPSVFRYRRVKKVQKIKGIRSKGRILDSKKEYPNHSRVAWYIS